MYPRSYYEAFLRYEANDEVFVAMPFSPPFAKAYEQVIEPAIRHVAHNGKLLRPHIVNRTVTGAGDIHTKIFDAILHSRLVIADMTVQACYDGSNGRKIWQPNANVAYEVGLAAAWRNSEDILLIHQQTPDHQYSFDVQSLRHVRYGLDDVPMQIAALIAEINNCLEQSVFLAHKSFEVLALGLSPMAVKFMTFRSEAHRANTRLSGQLVAQKGPLRPGYGSR
jgi:hypothetical protein